MNAAYAYLGPKGTYTEDALSAFLETHQPAGVSEQLTVPCNSIEEVLTIVHEGKADFGMVPVENSIEGIVNQTLDILIKLPKLKIAGEYYLPIRHSLMAKPGMKKAALQGIASHPQALAQCRSYIQKVFAGKPTIECGSTAEAARKVSVDLNEMGVIGNENASLLYGLDVVERDVQDYEENVTRFLLVSKKAADIAGPAKTSIMVSITDRPGGLFEILKEFALANLNLTRIESRPAKKSFGDYVFFIDFIGNPSEPEVAKGLAAIDQMSVFFRVAGTYPVENYKENRGANSEKKPVVLEELRQQIDIVDYQIVELLARRTEIVSKIGAVKGNPILVRDTRREGEIIERLRQMAEKKGVHPTLVEKVYTGLFDYFVELQEKQLTGCQNEDE